MTIKNSSLTSTIQSSLILASGAAIGILGSKWYAQRRNQPSKVWKFTPMGGTFGSLNRPTAGPQNDNPLPKGSHPLQLYSLGTPNGQKVTILLEELCSAYGIQYDAWFINIMEGDQFSKGFVDANPNSKIPALLHYGDNGDGRPPTRVFESGCILLYLCEMFDEKKLFFPDVNDPRRAECLSWLFWVQGAAPFVGGGFGHFFKYAPIKIRYAIDRYTMETKRLLDVLERRLSGADDGDSSTNYFAGGPFLCGDTYTIADMCCFPWFGKLVEGKVYPRADEFLNVKEEYPHVLAWAELVSKRMGVKRGMVVNKTWGEEGQLRERHDVKDFEELRLK